LESNFEDFRENIGALFHNRPTTSLLFYSSDLQVRSGHQFKNRQITRAHYPPNRLAIADEVIE
jgi:hypothetical protein